MNLLTLSLSMVTALLLAGCSKTVTWKEEVQLSDGRTIVIERETLNAPGGGDLRGPGYHPDTRILRVQYPGGTGKQVEWISTKKWTEYPTPEKPLVLDVEGNELVLYSIVYLSGGCSAYSKYAYRNGQWSEEALPDEFPERVTNLILRDAIEMPEFVRIEDTRKNNRDDGYSRSLKKVGPKRIACGR